MASTRYTPGLHSALRILKTQPEKIRRVLIDAKTDNERLREVRSIATAAGVAIESTVRYRLDALAGGSRHQGVIVDLAVSNAWDDAALRSFVEEALVQDRDLLFLYLDEVQDPHNLGACMRTAEAAGVDAVIAPQKRAASLTPAARKIASGAAEALPFAQVADPAKTLDWMRAYGIRVVATADGAQESIYAADLSGSLVLVVGSEERGVTRRVLSRCDATVSLPMLGEVESLNVSVATGICLYEIRRRGVNEAQLPATIDG